MNTFRFTFCYQIRKDFTNVAICSHRSTSASGYNFIIDLYLVQIFPVKVKPSLLTSANQGFCTSRYQINWSLCLLLQVRICLWILSVFKVLSCCPWLLKDNSLWERAFMI